MNGFDIALTFFLVFIALLTLTPFAVRVSNSRAASAVRSSVRFFDDGILLAKPMEVEFGLLKARGYYSRGYHITTEFFRRSSALVDRITYSDLCSDTYLLATDSRGVGYLIAPGVRIASREGRNVIIMCMDPSKIPKLSKSIEITESQTSVRSEVELKDGRYVVKASWAVSTPGQWGVLYDEKKGVYTITTTPEVRGRVRGAAVKLCARPQQALAVEICDTVLEVRRPGEEVVRELSNLQERKVVVEHLNLINLSRLAKSVGITTYPHISGYANGMVRVKLVLDIPLARNVVREEVI
ncbi:MAG: hypothetical protein QXS42_01055 [Zestosphaera sp.]